MLSRLFIPFLLMLFMNIVLVRSLFVSKNRSLLFKSQTSSSSPSGNRHMHREMNYMKTVITLNWIFFILNIPWAVWYIISHIGQITPDPNTARNTAILNLILAISHCVFYLNNLSSFVLNMIFNRIFRKKVFLIKRKRQGAKKLNEND